MPFQPLCALPPPVTPSVTASAKMPPKSPPKSPAQTIPKSLTTKISRAHPGPIEPFNWRAPPCSVEQPRMP
eukprot:3403863-Alexandrium_andersonii.AAC.2